MSAPIIRNYKGGSIIYFEKDRAEDIYVLRSGRVVLTYPAMETGYEVKEDVRIGEFFGVKSALGKYPREETAQVVGGASVLVFKLADFEEFVAQKTHLILKMMKVFSSQLRQVHRKVRDILGEGEAKNPAYELMNVAEVYYKNNDFEHAVYAFEKYLEHYPTGNYAGRAKELVELARKGSPYPVNIPPLSYEAERKGPSPDQIDSFMEPAAGAKKESTVDASNITALYNRGRTLLSAGQTDQAISIFKDLMVRADHQSDSEHRLVEESAFQLGFAYFKGQDFNNANSTFSLYIKKSPSGEHIKEALFYLANIAETKGDADRAKMLFGKVSQLPPQSDDYSQKAQAKMQELS